MKHKEIQIKIAVYREGEAPPALSDLLQKAHQALPNAYAPYSHYRVAAAVLMENGEVVTGTNQENMAYPSGLCAERVAIFAAGSQFPGMKMVAVAIVATPENLASSHPSASCGACRQSMLEYELNQSSPIAVCMQGKTGEIWVAESVGALLPLHFDGNDLKKKR